MQFTIFNSTTSIWTGFFFTFSDIRRFSNFILWTAGVFFYTISTILNSIQSIHKIQQPFLIEIQNQ